MTFSSQATEHRSRSTSTRQSGGSILVEDHEEPTIKPKKVNSEHRKQQNRIASRNYREKRKRRLHHLQSFVGEESTEYQRPSNSPEHSVAHAAPVSMDRASTISRIPSYQSTFSDDCLSEHSSSIAFPGSPSSTGTLPFSSPHFPTAQLYPPFAPPNWNMPMYSPPPPPEIPCYQSPIASSDLSHSHSHTRVPPSHIQHVNAYDFSQPPTRPSYDSSNMVYQNPQYVAYPPEPAISLTAFASLNPWEEQDRVPVGSPNVNLPPSSTSSRYHDERFHGRY
ncbi:hypothetical protein NX059_008039 [Plenodomus lindquistii]|nr:hypothetical protein NX059_008039 [Plenodomus lindquistii]